MPSSCAITRGRARVIAGDHDRPDAGAPGARHRVLRLRPRRIDHADQSGEDEILFDAFVGMRGVLAPARPSVSQRTATPSVRSASPASASLVCRISRAALGRQRPPARRRRPRRVHRASSTSGAPLVKTTPRVLPRPVSRWSGAHQLALGGERHLADARQALVERVGARGPPCAPRRAARPRSDRPAPSSGRPARCTVALFARSATRQRALELDAAGRRRAGRRPRHAPLLPARSPSPSNVTRPLAVTTTRTVISFLVSVPVLSEAMTVAEPSVSTAGQVADDGVPPRHALHADRQHGGDDRRQAFGHGGDRQRDAEDEHVEQRRRRRARPRRR